MSDIEKEMETIGASNVNPNITSEDILNLLLTFDENIEMKTEINHPKKIASLLIFAEFLEDHNYPISSERIISFCQKYFKLMVSNKRQGRKEIIEAYQGLRPTVQDNDEFKSLIANFGK